MSPRLRGILWLGGILAVLGLLAAWAVWLAVAPALANLAAADEDARLAQHLRALEAEKPRFQAALAAAQSALAGSGALFAGASPELQGAALQEAAQDIVAQAGGQVASAAIEPAARAHGLEILSVSLTFALPAAQFPQLLAGIDANRPYLEVNALDARAGDGGVLTVQLDVSGFSAPP